MTRPLTLTLSFLACSLLALEAKAGYPMVPDALDPQARNGQGCWTNHMRVTDIDGDGSLDIVLANYADLRAAFGTNLAAGVAHYITSGYREGRTDKAPPTGY